MNLLKNSRRELEKYDSIVNVNMQVLVEEYGYGNIENVITLNEPLFNSTMDSIIQNDFLGKAPERNLIKIRGVYSYEYNLVFVHYQVSDIKKYWNVKTEKFIIFSLTTDKDSIKKLYEINRGF